jgi:enamine deaminase RidA (YjgF/YER057c/UK114 family)
MQSMVMTQHNPADLYPPHVNYAHAVETVLRAHLGEHRAARTVICGQLLEPGWLIELEAIAAKRG